MKIFKPDEDTYRKVREGNGYIRMERGLLRGTGADRLDLLHRISTNAINDLIPGGETTTILTSDKGRIMEILRVLAFESSILMLTSNPDTEFVRQWLDKYTIMDDFVVTDVTDGYAAIGIYGEHARGIVRDAAGLTPPDTGTFASGEFEGGELFVLRDVRLSGAGGFLLLVARQAADALVARLHDLGVVELDAETYETLKIEAGQPTMGRELSEGYNPLEAGIVQHVSFKKGCYIGQEVIARLDTYDKVQRHLVGLLLDHRLEEDVPAELVLRDESGGTKVGVVTSITRSPALGRTIGLGYVRTQYAVPGASVKILADSGEGSEEPRVVATATISKLPFDV